MISRDETSALRAARQRVDLENDVISRTQTLYDVRRFVS